MQSIDANGKVIDSFALDKCDSIPVPARKLYLPLLVSSRN